MDELSTVQQLLTEPPPGAEVVEAARLRLERVARGDTPRVLAQRLQLREQVVRNYLHRIYRQLRVASRSELIALLSN